jgi:hypothetical protein
MEQCVEQRGRLTDHRKNIGKASANLSPADFEFRSLVIQSGWETFGTTSAPRRIEDGSLSPRPVATA